MSGSSRLRWCATVLCLLPSSPSFAQRPEVLFLTHSAGYQHAVVKRIQKGKAALAEHGLRKMAEREMTVTATPDCATITADNLARYDAVVFYTSGVLPLPDGGMQALLDWVAAGGAFVGIHSATDTFKESPPYVELIGGVFAGHPWHEEVRLRVEDSSHPAVARFGQALTITDEIYQFRAWSRERCQVLLSLDPESVDVTKGRRDDDDYAVAWSRTVGEGRMFYTALGHRPEIWQDRRFQHHLMGGLRWALGAERTGRPPAEATILFDGVDTSRWQHPDGKPVAWKVEDGAMEVTPSTGSIVTRDSYQDFRLHVEFRTPRREGDASGQARGNSGVYLQRRYEVQILDSHGLDAQRNGCGALYRQRAPDVNRCLPPEQWQSYDIWFRAPRWGDDRKKAENGRLTLVHNGVVIHDDVEVTGKTGAGQPEGPEPGPILLQDHGNPVQFRNVWITPG